MMDTKKKQSYNLYKTNEGFNKLLYKHDKYSSNNTPKYKTSYTNSKANSKIMDKKYISKRDEILRKSKTAINANNLKKSNENNEQNLFSFTFPYMNKKDKEGLIVDLYHVSNEKYNNLLSNSLAFKIIIEKILNVDENGNSINKKDDNDNNNDNKIKENNKSENNLKLFNNPVNQNSNENFPNVNNLNNNNNIINQFKTKKNKLPIKNVFDNEVENATKLNILQREKKLVSKKLIDKENKLDKIKNLEKIKNFEECVSKLKTKNNELEELITFSKELQIDKFETENKIISYNNKIKKFSEEINSINEKCKYNKKELENGKADVDKNVLRI